jgi:hypothetical protein
MKKHHKITVEFRGQSVSKRKVFEMGDFWTGSSITKDFVDAVP